MRKANLVKLMACRIPYQLSGIDASGCCWPHTEIVWCSSAVRRKYVCKGADPFMHSRRSFLFLIEHLRYRILHTSQSLCLRLSLSKNLKSYLEKAAHLISRNRRKVCVVRCTESSWRLLLQDWQGKRQGKTDLYLLLLPKTKISVLQISTC